MPRSYQEIAALLNDPEMESGDLPEMAGALPIGRMSEAARALTAVCEALPLGAVLVLLEIQRLYQVECAASSLDVSDRALRRATGSAQAFAIRYLERRRARGDNDDATQH